MPEPFILVQLTDPHIGASWGGWDPVALLDQTVRCISELSERPDAILITGDLTDAGADDEYAAVKRLLDPFDVPCYPLAGNHDDRGRLRDQFGLPGDSDSPINYSVDLGSMRLVALDSTKPGHDAGEVDEYRLEWLDRELSDAPEQTTLLAMHHPPLVTGEASWDRIGLPAGEREALGSVLDRHRQVQLVVGGHLHRTIVSRLAGRTVLAAPAVYGGSVPDFGSDQLKIVRTAPALVVHALAEGGLTSHVLRAE